MSVPRGKVGAQAGRTTFGSFEDQLNDGLLSRKLPLMPAPPMTGHVRDPKGRPVAGATVRVRGIGLSSEELHDVPAPARGDRTALTDQEGFFVLDALPSDDLFFSVTLDAPLRGTSEVFYATGDAPLELVAVPLEPDSTPRE